MREGDIVIKYKLYAFSGATYVAPLDKYEYVDNTVERCFEDYCVGVLHHMNLIDLSRNASLIMVVDALIFGAMIIMLLRIMGSE